ncbi:MAG: carboxypeptidase regulatory-like domain-containing protein, partial [Gemmatimonadetes bacterium]|nr:carboxypeptidase regulatory-like domain-containing protein [Gemmatimonadota bacterium]
MKLIKSNARGLATLLVMGLIFAACGDDPPTSMDPAAISGTVSIDGVGAPGITVDLTGESTSSATTDASGAFSFVDLAPGTYTVAVAGTDTELVNFDAPAQNVTLRGGQQRTVMFTGTPTGVQRLMVYSYYGIEGSNPNVAPADGFQIDVYRTSSDRDSETNRLARATTDATGAAVLTFNRSDDTGESGGAPDNTVYTRVSGTPGPRQIGQTDLQQTVSYQSHEVVALAPDTVDALNGEVTAELRIQTIQTSYTGPEGSALLKPEWSVRTRVDTAAAGLDNDSTGFDGVASFDLFTDVASLPTTIYFRLDDGQSSDAGNIWTQTPEPSAVSGGAGRHLVYVHDGTQAPGTVDLGIQRVEYITSSVFAPVFHVNYLAETTPIYTVGGDDKDGSSDI